MFAALAPVPAAAQSAPQVGSREVVQPLPPRAADDLSSALRRLGTNALDGRAMLDAGWASLELDDVTAAVGFFSRAQELPEFVGEAKAGLGAAQVYRKRPVEALALFDEADAAGVKLGNHAAIRGLAYDMVGDNARAQPFYRMALQAGGLSDEKEQEITRQLALSQAIGGDQAGSEATLLPLLKRSDLAAYRTRAFALAALGKTEEAVSIANAVMPASLAGRIAPYLRYMPKLTRAQQASAGNFGHFPDADMIGKDDPAIAQYTAQAKPVQLAAAAPLDARLTPSGAPLGSSEGKGKGKPASPPAGTVIAMADKAKPAPKPAADVKAPAQTPPPARAQQPTPAIAAQLPPPSTPTPAPVPQPAFSLPPSSGSQVALAAQPAAASQAAPALANDTPPPAPASLADAFAEFSSGPAKVAPAPGAVDITRIAVRREPDKKAEAEKAKAEAEKAKAEADKKAAAERKKAEAEKKKQEAEKKAEAKKKADNPSRVWVQVGTGQNRSAIAFTWRKFQKEQSKLFGSRKGYVAAWGRTNRLLTGPFTSAKEANAFIKQLKSAGIDCFIFTSDAGEEVSPVS
ncbi:MAG: hypothetical protein BGO57_02465 [Sphingomonadales bacterium 63-6]|nr:MAG: hypothetical protein BGO57_02465 [Sphingomonadales bacterium 63-6]